LPLDFSLPLVGAGAPSKTFPIGQRLRWKVASDKQHSPHSFRRRQTLPNDGRKPFEQKSFWRLKALLSGGR
jgi:hypothetical protein